jgi:hypothetical protein
MPSAEEELRDSVQADLAYAAAADKLRPQTNDRKEFPFIFKELMAYGFNRNAYGVRWVGFSVAILIVITTLANAEAFALESPYWRTPELDNAHTIVLVLSLTMAVLWCAHFTGETVRLAGVSYAKRLWEALDRVPQKSSRAPRKRPVSAA